MKTAILGLCLALVVSEAQAISRYTSTSLTCDEIKSTIRSDGNVFLKWRSRDTNLPRYGIFIANRRICLPDEGTEAAYVPARDQEFCAVRKCVPLDLSSGR